MKIPSEIIFEIFLRLPVKSLMRFKCISKFCNSLIGSNSVFKDVYGRHYSMTRPTFLIHEWDSVYTVEQIKDWKARGYFDRLLRGCEEFGVQPSVTCVNGLFCLWNKFVQPAVICNPSTREVRFLPQLNIVSNYIMFLLGFDPEENKYKILMSAKLGDKKFSSNYELVRDPARNWVFTLGIDESWREINNNSVSFCPRIGGEICVSGVIYQLNFIHISDDHSGWNILAFDVKDEDFRIISLWTSPIDDPMNLNYMLTEVKGKLAVIVLNKLVDMDLWILGKMDGEWEKHIIAFPLLWLKDLPFERMCFCFRTQHEGEIVVAARIITKQLGREENRTFLYLCYDVTRRCWREFESQGLPVHGLIDRIHFYAESLVSLIKSSHSPPCFSILHAAN